MNTDRTWKLHTRLTKNKVIKPLKICMKSNFFQSKDRFFQQQDSCPMGSPISPLTAEFAMRNFEKIKIKNYPSLNFYKRFVDDSLSAIEEGTYEELLEIMNSYSEGIQFTCERETQMEIAFLDLHIKRDNEGKLHRKVYRKPTATGRYLNFDSYHYI